MCVIIHGTDFYIVYAQRFMYYQNQLDVHFHNLDVGSSCLDASVKRFLNVYQFEIDLVIFNTVG